jgi:Fe2+ or Zn2+ uptake regulation protein
MSVAVVHRYYHPKRNDHLYTIDAAEIGVTKPGQVGVSGYTYESSSFSLFAQPHHGLLPVYRYYHTGFADHFYTTNIGEIGVVKAGQTGNIGYKCEGIIGYISPHEFPGSVPIYRYFHDSNHDHFYTTNAGEIGTTTLGQKGKFGYVFEGILGYAYHDEPRIKPVQRYYHEYLYDHFYTTNADEIGTITPGHTGPNGYKHESVAFNIFSHYHDGLVPLYRYYHESKHDHLYTTSTGEIGTTTPGNYGQHGYRCEEILGYVSTSEFSGSLPIYRYFNESFHDHLYTTNASEIGTITPGQIGNYGYKFECIVGYVPQ